MLGKVLLYMAYHNNIKETMTGITITSGFQQEHKFKPTPKLFYDERFEKKDKKVFDFLNYKK